MTDLKEKIVTEIKKIYDPEIPVNIYELGLIYKIEIVEKTKVLIDMTLTSPNCPVAESLPKMVKDNILKLAEVDDVDLKLGWNPQGNNDNVDGGSHGVNVAGMVGAVGNNETGVVGVNWNVKIMNMTYGSIGSASNPNEANVIESYTYPRVMRRF